LDFLDTFLTQNHLIGVKTARKFPVTVKSGSIRVKIYQVPQRDGSKIYSIDWRLAGKRHRKAFSDYERARLEADSIASKLASGDAMALQLTGLDRAIYVRAKQTLAPLGGIAIDVAVARFAEAVRILGSSDLVVVAARDFARRHPANMPKRTVSEVVRELIEAKRSAHRSLRYVQDLESRGGSFAQAFQCQIQSVSGADLRTYLDGKKMAPRTYKNHVRTIGTLFEFAKSRGYLPKDFDSLDGIELPDDLDGEIEIYTPEEIAALLAHADPRIVPAIAIGGFAGLRSAELERLSWNEVRLADNLIEVKAKKSKTRSRRLVPITPNLAEWLALYVRPSGPVLHDVTGSRFYQLLEKCAADANLTWKRNGLRHSFATYRLADIQNVNALALEMGNSPQMIFGCYRELSKPEQAKAWFAIAPPKPAGNILPMAAGVAS